MEESEEYKTWIKRRNINTKISYISIFLIGLEFNSVIITMLYYLLENFDITVEEARMYFSLAEMMNAFGETLGGALFGRYTDRTRNLRRVVLTCLWATIIGNIVYALPYHVACLIIGRFLCGFNEAFQVVFSG